MKYLTTVLFALSVSCLYSQDLPLIKAFAKQNFICHKVKYFSELKRKVDIEKSERDELYYLVKDKQVLGFVRSKDFGDPRFFISNEDTFTLFLSEGIDDSVSIYESILRNSYSIFSIDVKNKSIYYCKLQWRYPNWKTVSSEIWKFEKDSVKMFSAYPIEKIRPINLSDSLIYNGKINLLKDIQFEKMKLVGIEKNDNNLKPSILIFLMNLTKER